MSDQRLAVAEEFQRLNAEIDRLRAAVLVEREACAAIVDGYRHATIYRDAVQMCDRIISDIRARTGKGEHV